MPMGAIFPVIQVRCLTEICITHKYFHKNGRFCVQDVASRLFSSETLSAIARAHGAKLVAVHVLQVRVLFL